MVVVTLLSVDLVESVDLVSVVLVVNCTCNTQPINFYVRLSLVAHAKEIFKEKKMKG